MNTACLELWEESLSTTFFVGSRAIVVVAEAAAAAAQLPVVASQ